MAKDLNEVRGRLGEPITNNETLPSTNTKSNPWLDYGNVAAASNIIGHLMKFTKFGEYLAGEELEQVPIGTKMIADPDEIATGYIKWEDNRPVIREMGRLSDGFVPPRRADLGDTDKTLWDINDDDGQPRDPWQFSASMVLYDPETELLYTFATGSKGGHEAIGKIAKAYGQRCRMTPGMFPVIQLNWTEYDHRIARYGKVRKPVFDIIGWTDRGMVDEVLLTVGGGGSDAAQSDQGTLDYYDDAKQIQAKDPMPPEQVSKTRAAVQAERRREVREERNTLTPAERIAIEEPRPVQNLSRAATELRYLKTPLEEHNSRIATRKPRF